MQNQLLMQVETSFPLTGLGVLVLPVPPAPALAAYGLHTTLPVRLVLPSGEEATGLGSVEEVTRPGAAGAPASTGRALLLTHEGAGPLPAGTLLYCLPPDAGEELT
ncbi:hypothetical protein [Hymenobacter weizhouensis]|uniref:hypothetical protein n=1 Tax=Hymenobacter sp. YIM 151500-1 TaxID=2987689 RepID=UPI00222784D6|nr:hypothetical protein [Hymenobacter sp. YIM 151500-1]UYZ61502.1 hypothetical protein OIS53_10825 [Hymenobacter sp. YIM 151500-1]